MALGVSGLLVQKFSYNSVYQSHLPPSHQVLLAGTRSREGHSVWIDKQEWLPAGEINC